MVITFHMICVLEKSGPPSEELCLCVFHDWISVVLVGNEITCLLSDQRKEEDNNCRHASVVIRSFRTCLFLRSDVRFNCRLCSSYQVMIMLYALCECI